MSIKMPFRNQQKIVNGFFSSDFEVEKNAKENPPRNFFLVI